MIIIYFLIPFVVFFSIILPAVINHLRDRKMQDQTSDNDLFDDRKDI